MEKLLEYILKLTQECGLSSVIKKDIIEIEPKVFKFTIFEIPYFITFKSDFLKNPENIVRPFGLTICNQFEDKMLEIQFSEFYKISKMGCNKIIRELEKKLSEDLKKNQIKQIEKILEVITQEMNIIQSLRRLNNKLLIFTSFIKTTL